MVYSTHLANRLIACFDIKHGRVTKACKFQDNIDISSPIELASRLYQEGIDELIFYDILASAENRQIDIKIVREVAACVFVPFTVGGGIKTIDDMFLVLDAGAEKISIDSMAVRNPQIITEGANAFGQQCMVLSMQVKRVPKSDTIPSGFEIAIDGARVYTGMDAVEWAKKGEALGAGEICVNSIDNDGTHQGYDLEITRTIAKHVKIPVIASGGAGRPEHLKEVFQTTQATAGIISSMLYSPRIENVKVAELKEYLQSEGVNIRPLDR